MKILPCRCDGDCFYSFQALS